MRRCAVVLATALISVAALAGCGSADDAASEASDETSSTTNEPSPDDGGASTDDGDDGGDKSGDESASDKAGDKDDADDKGTKSDADDDGAKGDKNDKDDKTDKGDDKDDKADSVSGDYCAAVRSLKADFDPSNSASLANATDMDAIVDRFQEITDAAPASIRSDWASLTSAYTSLAKQLDKYDIKLTDPKGFTKLKPDERKAVQSALARTQKVAGSVGAISADIKSTCGIKLQ